MTAKQEFNPIEAAKRIERSYREYIAATIHFADHDLQGQLEQILAKPGYLAKGPFLEAAPPYHKDQSVADLVSNGLLCESMLRLGGGDASKFDARRPLYTHQVRAIEKAAAGRNYAVVTGTGSGKTECFLLPILNDILAEFEAKGASPGVRAIILYPMNALANDQLKRLRILLEGTNITFGRYTGDTEETESHALPKWKEENPDLKRLPNEIISREEIRKNPPNILLTNYSMLEYLLLRPKDAPLFGGVFGANWRHIAIDEAHIYSGALGTEIAYLIRRLKARIASEVGVAPRLHCYATSATIGSEEDMPKVAEFSQDLFGEPFSSDSSDLDVITSDKDLPQEALDATPWGSLFLKSWGKLRRELASDCPDYAAVRSTLIEGGAPSDLVASIGTENFLLDLGRILLGEESTAKVVRRCATLLDLTDLTAIEDIGIERLHGDSEGVATLTAIVEVLSLAQRSPNVPILTSRYHSFLRAPEGVFINLFTKELIPSKTVEVLSDDGKSTPIYEVSVCRHCGHAYILGQEKPVEGMPYVWLDPRHEGTNADDEFIPNKYYRVLDDIEDKDEEEEVQWLCPVCGTLHSQKEDGAHRYQHEPVGRIPVALNQSEGKQANERIARCRHCGYQSAIAIQPMRVSPEAAGSVVCYDLAREIPPFNEEQTIEEDDWFGSAGNDTERRAGSVICFSDKRQDAAFFAPALERTYGNITRRQLIREAVETKDDGEGCSAAAVVNWIASEGSRRYPGLLGDDKKGQAEAWLLDELAAEDSRNSLDGLGVIRIEPTLVYDELKNPKVISVVERAISSIPESNRKGITPDDFVLILKASLEYLRGRNAIKVPEGIDSLRVNHEKRGNWIVVGGPERRGEKDTILFAGSGTNSPENAFGAFARKYMLQVHGVSLNREDSQALLQAMFKFLSQFLGTYCERLGEKYLDGQKDRFRLNKSLWTLYRHGDDDLVYRCDTCGCETHLDTKGVCTTYKCNGRMMPITFAEAHDKDRFYKDVYQDEALPLEIEEHTAQLSSEKAREIQSRFIKGDVNVLSCTTTFELGVDVGDLRAIFMRNVPPSTANYTQRAGRVGRRAGMPGYAITFARLRPHDIAYYADPGRMISGRTRVPSCYLNNSAIAIRHVFAVAMSEFFRFAGSKHDIDYSHHYNDFMDLGKEFPCGLNELRDYLESRPEVIAQQVDQVLPPSEQAPSMEEIGDWRWVEELTRPEDPAGEGNPGRLVRTHALKNDDYARINEGIEANMDTNDSLASSLVRTRDALKKELTISVLAESGILPKYGFPTDLVDLHLPEMNSSIASNRLSLSRGMRQAIREYAPGSEIVAGKTLWKSIGIKRPRGRQLETRNYGRCPSCKTFVWPIENFDSVMECPVCGEEIHLEKRMLIPSYGFEGKKSNKGIGLRKPRSRGFSRVYFSQHWPNETSESVSYFAGGAVSLRYAGNGQLCVLNAPNRKFHVCDRCGAAAVGGEELQHWEWCKRIQNEPFIAHHDALGASFVSDVLELTIEINSKPNVMEEDWNSVLWTLFTAASNLLEIPETELGGTMYENTQGSWSVMIYDDVPGGAGHSRWLFENASLLFEEAYRTVDGHCGCGEETCCCGCIANYYNQQEQSNLSRGAAKRILGELLGR